MKKRWHIRQPDTGSVKRISHILKCHPITAAVLVNRKILSAQEANDFLSASLNNIRSPFAIKDMDAAVERIYAAIAGNQKILIFGDYDVDGITATSILMELFQYIGANVSYYIPHRIKEGYSLQVRHITDYALPNRIDLIITTDCGSASFDAVTKAREFGIDVIITDHHSLSQNLPPAAAVINPKRHDCAAGFEHLAGVGVAFCLLICLRTFLRDKQFWDIRKEPNLKNLCDLVALGTIADMAPLIHENRIFSKVGLDLINGRNRLGIAALLKAAGISNIAADSDDLAFRLAPRLNAAGRMDHASLAVDLLTADDIDKAEQIARSLTTSNQKRQDLEKKIIDQILTDLAKNPELLQKRTLVLWNQRWHEGVLGIVASRMVAKFYRPVVLIAVKDRMGKGSGRSIPEIDLYEKLVACENMLEKFGGHPMAAGLSLKAENLELFRQHFEDAMGEWVKPEDLMPQIYIDGELDFKEISDRLLDELESLAPFGSGNPEPLFLARNVVVASSKIVANNHRRMVLRQTSGSPNKFVNAIHFNFDRSVHTQEAYNQIVFKLRWNRWNGIKKAQLVIEDA